MESPQIVVFTNDAWVSVTIPKGHDPCWTTSDTYYYASSYIAAKTAGFPEKRSEILAEAFVSKRIYPGLVFDQLLENDLQNLKISRE